MTSTQNIGGKTLLLLVSICMLLGACKNDNIEKVRVITAADNLPMEEGSNILLNYTDSGFVKAKVFAPIMQRFDNEKRNQSVMTKGITAYFYDKDKKITSYIKSKYAVRDDQQRTMTAKYDVIVVNIKGDTLRTESLVWDEKTNLISTNEAVKITTKNDIIYGDGLETNSAFNPYKILKIRGIVSIK